ncbi:MAG: glutathione peroxidase [Chromatiales bacterium]|jgi:glutathione peroxidase|nr:glutathione peroxidase [Chromatiales bacterium]
MSNLQSFSIAPLAGEKDIILGLDGKVVLLVNVASQCGLTPHYAGLQKLYEELKGQDFTVVGLPCNQFGAQEPGNANDIEDFCKTNYGVTFPLTEKIKVNGEDQHPLYAWLTTAFPGDIEWNFEKFLINRDGEVIKRYPPQTEPEDPELQQDICEAL